MKSVRLAGLLLDQFLIPIRQLRSLRHQPDNVKSRSVSSCLTLFNADSWMSCGPSTRRRQRTSKVFYQSADVFHRCQICLIVGGFGSPFVEPNEFPGAYRAAMCELQRARLRIMRSTGRARRLGVGWKDEIALVAHRLIRIISKLRTILGRAAFNPGSPSTYHGRSVVSSISQRSATTLFEV